ncbi:MAG: NADH-quinone oxidoreductase subunit L [Anaerolineae bacterium]|nr:NADH-quinone oxidoreductase subunit L [Anaerolineae bacterium]
MDVNWFSADYLPWLIMLFPLLGFLVIVLGTNRSVIVSQAVALAGIGIAWLLSMLLFVKTVWTTDKALGQDVFGSQLDWLKLGAQTFRVGVLVDPLTAYMLLMVPLVCLLIFVYSLGYMRGDRYNARFFAYLSLFSGAMLTLVVADNLLLLFIGWEVMGFCSYSLIGFWFHKKTAMEAGVKAFMTTRVADVLMLVGVGYLFVEARTLNFRDILYNEAMLKMLAEKDAVIFGGSVAALVSVLLIIGTIGKSAQFPLHTWLPDAMEGPTPVSAMIHAAAMVSAGVYMIVRMFPLLSAGADFHHFDYNTPMLLMGIIGSVTALGAAVLAVGQSDIKRILAYSTISQLGYMVAALGIGAWVAAAFHLINHAFFKALLFMASGSVIHAMEHGEHHAHERGHDHEHYEEPDGLVMDHCAPPNNVQRMGGLIHRIPLTAITMAIGGLSLAGFPLITAGFWSKDEIIAEAWHGMTEHPFPLFVLLLLLVSAALTAFYTGRMWFLAFWGKPRTPAAQHAGPGSLRKGWVVWWNKRRWSDGYKLVQEPISRRDSLSASQMEAPLAVLAFFAIAAGFIGIHADLVGKNPLHDFLAGTLLEHPVAIPFNFAPMLVSMILAVGGLALGWWVYGRRPLAAGQTDPTEAALGPGIWAMLQNRFYIDLLYRRYLLRPAEWFAENIVIRALDKETIDGVLETIAETFTWLGEAFKRFNTVVIDGTIDGLSASLYRFAGWFRQTQTGRVQQYLLLATLGLLVIGTLFLIQVR